MFLLGLIFITLILYNLIKGLNGIKNKSISIYAFYKVYTITNKLAVKYSIMLIIMSGLILILYLALLFIYYHAY